MKTVNKCVFLINGVIEALSEKEHDSGRLVLAFSTCVITSKRLGMFGTCL